MTTDNMTPQKWAFHLTHILNAYASSHDRFPVDVKTLAKEFSQHKYPNDPITKVKGACLPRFDGGLVKAPKGRDEWGIIYNNSMKSKGRINFTLAHEFGHYLLHRQAYPNGIECGEQDIVRWDSAYAKIEHEANVFAANLLMPLDDYRKQIDPRVAIDLDIVGHCANRYEVSLMAAILRWIEYTESRAVLVVSRDGYILWARSSKAALRTGIYFKTSTSPPIPIPKDALASRFMNFENKRQGLKILPKVWFEESCNEMVVFSEMYDFTISLLQLEN
ncbi:MAG: ImmA/IrrE family metallo-endopeptidase [Methylophaga sp.]|uniref:ImmA/IrrE family metallo-endopeptidase n=1 Tax=Methylophaga sp. TaxID=2024840 RepID=UPI002171D72B|nr:ImmA/IrrE family metallo-endopeptidase [Methylophaga sp.]MBL1456500.1 ImmA/IrrE family metallo-endopeptidase [Methylophaga sp.]